MSTLQPARQLLPGLLAMSCALPVFAADEGGFLEDAKATLNLRNFYINRNFVDLAHPPPNPGYDELADAFVPPSLEGPVFDAAQARLKAYAERHGDLAWRIARAGGQYKHPGGIFYGGTSPTWSRRTHETIIAEYGLAVLRPAAPAARDFAAHLVSDAGQARLRELGFGPP